MRVVPWLLTRRGTAVPIAIVITCTSYSASCSQVAKDLRAFFASILTTRIEPVEGLFVVEGAEVGENIEKDFIRKLEN